MTDDVDASARWYRARAGALRLLEVRGTLPEQVTCPETKVTFDTANIKSTYCNVCNATSTHEEVVINFGVNKTWDRGDRDLEVQLEHRIILSPYAAKRLQEMLTKLITDHEQRHGVLR